TMDSPTLWNIDDKSDYLSVESNGLKVIYKGVISFNNLKMSGIQLWYVIYIIIKSKVQMKVALKFMLKVILKVMQKVMPNVLQQQFEQIIQFLHNADYFILRDRKSVV